MSLRRAAAVLFACALAWARPVQASEPLLVISYHDVRDDVARHADADAYAVSTQNFIAHLDWLGAHGYQPVSLSQVVAASEGKATLPDKPVLLTFDDGLRSMYTTVLPLLQAYRYPAVAAIVTSWMELPEGTSIDYGPRPFTRDDFMTWQQVRELQASGLVEIASHSDALHVGVRANPQGNVTPAAITRIWSPETGRYESEAAYRTRIRSDLARSRDLIEHNTGHAPRALVWPYAANNAVANGIADELGMPVTFDLEGRNAIVGRDLHGLGRLLMMRNPEVNDLVYELRFDPGKQGMRALQIDLDAVYDADPAQQKRNIDALIERVNRIHPSHVFLQAFADPDGDGAADALYFPNRHLPVRADLFGYVAWQLHTRAGVVVYAWLPALAYKLPEMAMRGRLAIAGAKADEIYRLDFTRPEARKLIADIYEDLGIAGYFEGLLFHDDAYLRDTELQGLHRGDTDARTQALIDFTLQLKQAAERWRPKLKTVRNLYAETVLDPRSQEWFAQQLTRFNHSYDYSALMAMPWLAHSRAPGPWMERLVEQVRKQDPDFRHTIFELQTVDWRTRRPVPGQTLKAQVRALSAAGVRHIAWYPDDFIADSPRLEDATEAMSVREFPYRAR